MRLTSLTLQAFRNHASETLVFDDGIVLLYGANGVGKTNIIESIFLCTCARSHRTGKDGELVRRGDNGYVVAIAFDTDRGDHDTLSLAYEKATGKRSVVYNGLALTRLSDLMGCFHAVVFAPEDLAIVKDGPAERRRFLDLLIARLKPRYFQALAHYHKLLSQRNALLKRMRDDGESEAYTLELDVWDDKLCDVASYLMHTRRHYVEALENDARQALIAMTDETETLALRLRTASTKTTKDDMALDLKRRLHAQRRDDIAHGNTSSGPHRDELLITLNGVDARAYASQGQQRSIVLALRLAELAVVHRDTQEKPVLLLDDVMSELDVRRRGNLLTAIRGYQTFVTCTDVHQVFSPDLADRIATADVNTTLNDADVCGHQAWITTLGDIHFYRVSQEGIEYRGTVVQTAGA